MGGGGGGGSRLSGKIAWGGSLISGFIAFLLTSVLKFDNPHLEFQINKYLK